MELYKRLDYLDMSRGVGILLVVLGHCYINNPIKNWLYSFHLPLFFIISGCLLKYKDNKENNLKELLKKRVFSLGIPYMFFSLFSLFCRFILNKLSIYSLLLDIKDTITFNGIGALWFLPALFIAEAYFLY